MLQYNNATITQTVVVAAVVIGLHDSGWPQHSCCPHCHHHQGCTWQGMVIPFPLPSSLLSGPCDRGLCGCVGLVLVPSITAHVIVAIVIVAIRGMCSRDCIVVGPIAIVTVVITEGVWGQWQSGSIAACVIVIRVCAAGDCMSRWSHHCRHHGHTWCGQGRIPPCHSPVVIGACIDWGGHSEVPPLCSLCYCCCYCHSHWGCTWQGLHEWVALPLSLLLSLLRVCRAGSSGRVPPITAPAVIVVKGTWRRWHLGMCLPYCCQECM